ncbi:MAG: UDP-2,3-diacylglucosamine diphosphatase [Betaproteobacteria bacterium]|nr:UDP-2,3-diacylglucosamine diphosphatase [Betaproteobacteria bacterium]
MATPPVLFISDLHLSPVTPGLNNLFFEFLGREARGAAALYILGDLFDAWIGDDLLADEEGHGTRIATALNALSVEGTEIFLLHGNRDFLLGEAFAAAAGARLLPDPVILSLPSWQFALSHGDALCTGDREYQAFRAQVRDPRWQREFLACPLAERLALAAQVRQQSEVGKTEKDAGIMDLDPAATDDFLRANGYATFIHGHTHRPARHDHLVDGIHVERWVLSDWTEESGAELPAARGEYLLWNGETLERRPLA